MLGSLLDALAGLPPWLVLLVVFVVPAAEASLAIGVMIPGETAVLVGGVIAHEGGVPLWAVILAAAAGAACGDQAGFLLGRRYGNRLVDRLPEFVRRSGDLDRALDLVRRRGAAAVAIGRWVAVLRAVLPGVAGTSGMGQRRFTVANVLGGTFWAAAIATAGYLVGASYRTLARYLGDLGDVVIAVVLVLVVATWLRRRLRARRAQPRPEKD